MDSPATAKLRTPEYLSAESVQPQQPSGTPAGPTTARFPLIYDPPSNTTVNFARLPTKEAMRTMDLAYREIPGSAQELLAAGSSFALTLTFFGLLVYALLLSFLPGVPQQWTLGVVVALGLAFFIARRRVAGSFPLGPPALGVTALVFCLQTATGVLCSRIGGTLLLGAVAIGLFLYAGAWPIEFFLDWLTAHPRLKPETRLQLTSKARILGRDPSYWQSFATLIFLFVGSLWFSGSSGWGIVLLYIFAFTGSLASARGGRFYMLRSGFLRAVGIYLTYGRRSTGAPGVWSPARSERERFWGVILFAMYFYGTLFLAFCFFTVAAPLVKLAADPDSAGAFLNAAPQHWLALLLNLDILNTPAGLSTILFSLANALVLPPLLLLAVYSPCIDRVLALHSQIQGEGSAPGLDDDGRPEWQWYVDRLRTSPHETPEPLGSTLREGEHLFLGIEPFVPLPVLLDKKILSEHCYIVGETGSGKTSLGLMPLLLQSLRGSQPRGGATPSASPIVILDLKGDPALFHTMREEAEACGRTFKFFTPEQGRASHRFNPFSSLAPKDRSLIQLCQLLMESLSLSHGEGYGRSYYARQSRAALLSALSKNPGIDSFPKLYEALQATKRDLPDTFELVSTIHALTFYPQLVADPELAVRNPEAVIHMPGVLEDAEVVYFWLPAVLESVSVREIGKLALYSLLSAAVDRQRQGREPRQCYLVIDEFQRIAGENFRLVLEQARSLGIAVILANQSQADLVTRTTDLRSTVRTNTRMKQYFTVTEPDDIRTLLDTSGEEVVVMKSSGTSTSGTESIRGYLRTTVSSQQREIFRPRLSRNDIVAATDHPLHSIVQISRGSGYTQFSGYPLVVRSTWPLTRDVYQRRSATPWPELVPELVAAEKSVQEIERGRDEEAAAQVAEQTSALMALLSEKTAAQPPTSSASD